MVDRNILFVLTITLGLLVSCSGSSTQTDPDPDPDPKTNEEEPAVTTGALEVSVVTTGEGSDEDGYTVTLEGNESQPIETDGTVTFEDLEEGSYSVELSGLGDDCTIEGDNPISADVTANETTNIEFGITCEQSQSEEEIEAEGTIIFAQADGADSILYSMNADGSNVQQVGDGIEGSTPELSPDGSQIVYVAGETIFIVNVDGSDNRAIATVNVDYSREITPAWSPDGSQIVYTSKAEDESSDTFEIYIMDTDGSNQTQLTDSEIHKKNPSWSENGIVYSTGKSVVAKIQHIDPESKEITTLVESDERRDSWQSPVDLFGIDMGYPAWSPDGSQIAYAAIRGIGENAAIYIVDADGSNPERIVSHPSISHPSWSPDGEYIAITGQPFNETFRSIWIVKEDGSQKFELTDIEVSNSFQPSWGVTAE